MKRKSSRKSKRTVAKKPLSVDLFLKKYPPNIRKLVSSLRTLIKKTIPNITEAVYPGWKLIGYRVQTEQRSHYFCFIAPFDEFIHLGFEDGTMLTDNHKLLNGDGKQVRHVVIRSSADIKRSHLSPLVAEAAMIALMRELIQHH